MQEEINELRSEVEKLKEYLAHLARFVIVKHEDEKNSERT